MRLLLRDHVIHSTRALQTQLWIKIYISMPKFLNNSSLQSSSFVRKQFCNTPVASAMVAFFMELKLLNLKFHKLEF